MNMLPLLASFSNVFQLAAACVLITVVITRSKKDICHMAMTSISIEDGPLEPGVKRHLFETYLTRFGFGYLLAGYLPLVFNIDSVSYNPCIGIPLLIILWALAWFASLWFLKRNSKSIHELQNKLIKSGEGPNIMLGKDQ